MECKGFGSASTFPPRTYTVQTVTATLHRRTPQAFSFAHPVPWVRWLALVCALLFGSVSTAQAAHVHKPATQGHHVQLPAAGTSSADTEEHCPLCAAVHAALPAPIPVAPSPALMQQAAVGLAGEDGLGCSWSFARFSRPPPARG